MQSACAGCWPSPPARALPATPQNSRGGCSVGPWLSSALCLEELDAVQGHHANPDRFASGTPLLQQRERPGPLTWAMAPFWSPKTGVKDNCNQLTR